MVTEKNLKTFILMLKSQESIRKLFTTHRDKEDGRSIFKTVLSSS